MDKIHRALLILAVVLPATASLALVNLDQGQRMVKGVQLLQDYSDPNAYYYVPQIPRLATRADGAFELLCLKYVDAQNGTTGGLFHALIEFTLPEQVVDTLEKELRKSVPAGRIAGPVQLMQSVERGQEGTGSFQVVSAVLSNKGDGGLTKSLVTSGTAPVTLGSKAAVAAILNQQGATLLWDSLTGATSDVSVAIHAYYEAAVRGYNARVTADVETVYTHFSQILSQQKDYTRRQIRNVIDDLERRGDLKVEVLDRTAGLGIKATDLDGILNIVVSKLTELMFDKQSGWSADPQREAAVEQNQILGRQERGWFSSIFGGAEDTKYYTDDQWVLKKRSDIKHNLFTITLSKDSTIKVPVDTAGNISGIYKEMKEDPNYFRVVNLDDPAFELRKIHFQVDGAYVDAFQDAINFVSVNVRKSYADRPAFTKTLRFGLEEIKSGKTVQEIAFPRLGLNDKSWTEFEFQVRWSLRDGPTLQVPPEEDSWIKTGDAAVALTPPIEKRIVDIDADRQLFKQRGVSTGVVEFATLLAGQPKLQRKLTLRAGDADSTSRVALYHDRGTGMAYIASWYASDRTVKGKLKVLDNDYLLLAPPAAEPPQSQSVSTSPQSPSAPTSGSGK